MEDGRLGGAALSSSGCPSLGNRGSVIVWRVRSVKTAGSGRFSASEKVTLGCAACKVFVRSRGAREGVCEAFDVWP